MLENSPEDIEFFEPPITDDEIEAAVTGLRHDTHDAPGRTFKEGFPKAMQFLEQQDADYWEIVDLAKKTLESGGIPVQEHGVVESAMLTGFVSAIEIFARIAEARKLLGPPDATD